jgi:hypothetical protein
MTPLPFVGGAWASPMNETLNKENSLDDEAVFSLIQTPLSAK